MMTSKEQEHKALEQIKKIVAGLGENSYIGMAFEGCFEVAEENIENDWGCSMKQRAEAAEKRVTTLELDNRDLRLAIKKVKEEDSVTITELQEKIKVLSASALDPDDLCDFKDMVNDEICKQQQIMEQSAATIVELADCPTDIAFANAVRNHRNAKRDIEYFEAIKERILKAKEAYTHI